MTVAKYPPVIAAEIVTDQWTAPFWSRAKEEQLVLCVCKNCNLGRMPPSPFCPDCRSQQIVWTPLTGTGVIYSYTVVRRAILPEMENNIPYVPAVVTLDGSGGCRYITAVVESAIEKIAIGAAVELVWGQGPGGHPVPYFRLQS